MTYPSPTNPPHIPPPGWQPPPPPQPKSRRKPWLIGLAVLLALALAGSISAALGDQEVKNSSTTPVVVEPKPTPPTVTVTEEPEPEPTEDPVVEEEEPVAERDEAAFVFMVKHEGGYDASYIGRKLLVSVGDSVCGALDRGASFNSILRASTDNGLTMKTKSALITGAPIFLCPEYADELEAWSER